MIKDDRLKGALTIVARWQFSTWLKKPESNFNRENRTEILIWGIHIGQKYFFLRSLQPLNDNQGCTRRSNVSRKSPKVGREEGSKKFSLPLTFLLSDRESCSQPGHPEKSKRYLGLKMQRNVSLRLIFQTVRWPKSMRCKSHLKTAEFNGSSAVYWLNNLHGCLSTNKLR